MDVISLPNKEKIVAIPVNPNNNEDEEDNIQIFIKAQDLNKILGSVTINVKYLLKFGKGVYR